MSTVKVETVEIKPAVPAVTEKVVVLNLSIEDAQIVRALLGKTGGMGTANDPFTLYDILDNVLENEGFEDSYAVTAYSGADIPTLRVDR